MNWERGFKRITRVLAIVLAVACGVVTGFLPIRQYQYASANWWYVNDPMVITPPTEKELAEFEIWQQDHTVTIDANYYIVDPNFSSEQTLITVCNSYFENRRKRFWYNLPIPKLIGIAVLYGLAGVVVGYVCTWVILWYGGLAIFILVGWLILGFADKKPKDDQNNK